MLAISRNVLFPGHNHLLATGTNDLTLDTKTSLRRDNLLGLLVAFFLLSDLLFSLTLVLVLGLVLQ